MSEFTVEAENLGKCYELGPRRLPAWGRIVGRPVGNSNAHDAFWALRDVSFKARRGEAIGILGRNGAGKSTLLKILARVVAPSEGTATLRGRVATLLEVGTGFHPDLSGRDNIFLSGTMLGVSRDELEEKFEEIVEFSEIGDFIDTPVKRLSSGMYVKLAFSVATALDPSVLILDEVLAVGDAAFQKKTLSSLSSSICQTGRTVLFVSHSIAAVRTFCTRVMLLNEGRIEFDGGVAEGIDRYLKLSRSRSSAPAYPVSETIRANLTAVDCFDEEGSPSWTVPEGRALRIALRAKIAGDPRSVAIDVLVRSAESEIAIWGTGGVVAPEAAIGEDGYAIDVCVPHFPLRPGEYSVVARLYRTDDMSEGSVLQSGEALPFLRVTGNSSDRYDLMGLVTLPHRVWLK